MKFILITSLVSVVYVVAMDIYTKATSKISLSNSSYSMLTVNVSGSVNIPGTYYVLSGTTYGELITQAGGFSNDADISSINVDDLIVESKNVYVSSIGEIKKININNASLVELKSLSGIGDVIAKRIVDYRRINGNFSSIEDVKNVVGIGNSLFEKIENYICVD